MPLDQLKQRLPQPGEWEEEWYMSWKARKENPNALFSRRENPHTFFSTSSSKKEGVESTSTPVRDKYALDDEDPSYADGEDNIPDDKLWKEPPEFGKLCTIRYKVGEPRSRLNWFLTSRLRRSRFRKKYFSARPWEKLLLDQLSTVILSLLPSPDRGRSRIPIYVVCSLFLLLSWVTLHEALHLGESRPPFPSKLVSPSLLPLT